MPSGSTFKKHVARFDFHHDLHGIVGPEKVNCGFPLLYLLDSTMQEFQCQATIRLCAPIVNAISV